MSEIVDIIMPQEDQEGTTTVVEHWLKSIGDAVNKHEPLLEINTDKVTVEIPSPDSGILIEIVKQAGEQVSSGEVLGRLDLRTIQPTGIEIKPREKPGIRKHEPSVTDLSAMLSPAVRRMLEKNDIDPSSVTGTGRGGRISIEDVERHLADRKTSRLSTQQQGGSRMIPHTQMRKRIAQHMVESALRTAPHVTDLFEADASAVVSHRTRHKEIFERQGVKLTYTAYFVDAAVKALRAVPVVNSRWHDDAVEVFEDCNIGVATALQSGLIVPVVHQAQHLDLFGTARVLEDLTGRARSGELTAAEVQNGTFTITNHGMTGSLVATPIINQPQSAILGLGKIVKRLVVDDSDGTDAIRIKPMLYVTLTIDHRVIDGFTANEFLNAFVSALEEW